ncbi:RDD family protein [Solibacillus sp. A46]|uniref:RDD family protein n=1 Tax=Solibacillus faecavium TaxID=2762221 RepID=A0ABR8XZZ2_9BACL|nr:RDD family protein [Solibacillus faecavium]MBD8037505.1 RDD family protein [Solibacillus faecavium]
MTEAIEVVDTTSAEELPSIKQKTAGFWMRFWAFILDSLVVSAIVGISIKPIFALMDWNTASNVWYAPMTIISGIIFYAYFVLLTKFFKQTFGKMVFGIKVEKENGEPLDWMTILFREVVGRFINSTLLYLPYLIVAFSPNNKSIADYFADTVVIHEKIYTKDV